MRSARYARCSKSVIVSTSKWPTATILSAARPSSTANLSSPTGSPRNGMGWSFFQRESEDQSYGTGLSRLARPSVGALIPPLSGDGPLSRYGRIIDRGAERRKEHIDDHERRRPR